MTAIARDSMIDILAEMIGKKDVFPSSHAKRVAKYSLLIAQELQLFYDDIELLYQSALMHDVGEKYSISSWKVLSKVELFHEHATIIKHIYERYDGSGYPDQLSKGNIPLLSRIIQIADSYDKMTANTKDKKNLPYTKALNELYKETGTKYDPILLPVAIKSLKNVLI